MKNNNESNVIFFIFEKKWSGLIILVLLGGEKNFSSIKKEIPGISDRILSQRLVELRKIGILKRCVYTEIPIRVKYDLTTKGQVLGKAFSELCIWNKEYN